MEIALLHVVCSTQKEFQDINIQRNHCLLLMCDMLMFLSKIMQLIGLAQAHNGCLALPFGDIVDIQILDNPGLWLCGCCDFAGFEPDV